MAFKPEYEFNQEQNQVIGSLASKMSLVGLFLILIGLGAAVLAVVGLLPLIGKAPTLPSEVPKEVADAFQRYQVYAQGNQEQLYYGVLAGALQALILIMGGVYVRRSAKAFRQIVDSAGQDITHLISALTSLRGLFGILYSLLILGLLLALGMLGMRLWAQFG